MVMPLRKMGKCFICLLINSKSTHKLSLGKSHHTMMFEYFCVDGCIQHMVSSSYNKDPCKNIIIIIIIMLKKKTS